MKARRSGVDTLAIVAVMACFPVGCSFFADTTSLRGAADASASDANADHDLDGGAIDVVSVDASTGVDVIPSSDATSTQDASAPRCLLGGQKPVLGPKSNVRGGLTPELVRAGYDLNPMIVREGATYVMWWDHEGEIARAEGAGPNGPWHSSTSSTANTWDTVLTGRPTEYDKGVGDPSVLHVNNVFYMYYVGRNGPVTSIGLATSATGLVWSRANNGAPIISALDPGADTRIVDGVAAFYRDGKYYLAFSDSTAPATTTVTTETVGTYLIRSSQPTFDASDVESLTASGWVKGDARSYAIIASRGGDVAYLPEIDRIALVEWGFATGLHLMPLTPPLTLDTTSLGEQGRPLGPGFVRSPEGTLLLSQDCTTIPIDYVREVGSDAGGTDIARFGFDVRVQ